VGNLLTTPSLSLNLAKSGIFGNKKRAWYTDEAFPETPIYRD
jgi:hypothetical protein